MDKDFRRHHSQDTNDIDIWNRVINTNYYNTYALLFDADFRTKLTYPKTLEHGWKMWVTVGMMQFLYNSVKEVEEC